MQFELLPPVPAVITARRLRENPLFRFTSVDELFRIAAIARQVRYGPGASVQEQGAVPSNIQVLLQGKLTVTNSGNGKSGRTELGPPAMLGFRESLEGSTLGETVVAATESIGLIMAAEEFRSLLADNIEVAQGLFRMLLGSSDAELPSRSRIEIELSESEIAGRPLRTMEKALLWEQLPAFKRATGAELFELAGASREVRLEEGATVFTAGDPPAVLLVLSGELALDSTAEGSERLISRGACLGIDETLAGRDWAWPVSVQRSAKALKIERAILFELLAAHMGLLQCIFGELFRRD